MKLLIDFVVRFIYVVSGSFVLKYVPWWIFINLGRYLNINDGFRDPLGFLFLLVVLSLSFGGCCLTLMFVGKTILGSRDEGMKYFCFSFIFWVVLIIVDGVLQDFS